MANQSGSNAVIWLVSGGADARDPLSLVDASTNALVSRKKKPRSSPVSAACAAATPALLESALEPFVSMAALTEATSPTIATLPPAIVKAACWSGASGLENTSRFEPLYVSAVLVTPTWPSVEVNHDDASGTSLTDSRSTPRASLAAASAALGSMVGSGPMANAIWPPNHGLTSRL